MPKTRIAILGGGVASLTAAYELTRTPELRDRYDVTVYQMGWRLGGKGASGRDAQNGMRILEHGLHMWFGFYENAFALMRDCYRERGIVPDSPLKTWRDAFKPQSFTPIGDEIDGKPAYWPFEWPTNSDEPGDGTVLLSPWGAITQLINLLRVAVINCLETSEEKLAAPVSIKDEVHSLFEDALGVWGKLHAGGIETTTLDLLHRALEWAKAFEDDHTRFSSAHHAGIEWLLQEFKSEFRTHYAAEIQTSPILRHLWNVLDVGVAIVSGVLNPRYGILDKLDLNVIDQYEFRSWLIENGASPSVVNDSNEVRALYDTCFAYDKGRLSAPNFAAGTAVRVVLRIVATYKEAVMFEMQAGMGEAVVAPMYEVLVRRGVRFAFFHKIERLELSPDTTLVAKIHARLQARTKGGAAYKPVFPVKGVTCWPSQPFWDQLVDGDKMSAANVDFESNWCDWPAADQVTLEQGKDFDQVVLGISLGAFKKLSTEPTMCDDLVAASAPFAAMVKNLGLVPTLAVQLWMLPDLKGLGWKLEKPAMVAGPEPLDIWADVSQVLPLEDWQGTVPRSVHYLCGVLDTPLFEMPTTDHDVPARALALVRAHTLDWFKRYPRFIWPAAVDAAGALDWNVLVADPKLQGADRLYAQYLRANVDPTECCVTSLTNTTQYRLESNQSGFGNLFLAGDWTRTGLNAACVESAVMSGMQASRAICGSPEKVVGEDFLQPRAGG